MVLSTSLLSSDFNPAGVSYWPRNQRKQQRTTKKTSAKAPLHDWRVKLSYSPVGGTVWNWPTQGRVQGKFYPILNFKGMRALHLCPGRHTLLLYAVPGGGREDQGRVLPPPLRQCAHCGHVAGIVPVLSWMQGLRMTLSLAQWTQVEGWFLMPWMFLIRAKDNLTQTSCGFPYWIWFCIFTNAFPQCQSQPYLLPACLCS